MASDIAVTLLLYSLEVLGLNLGHNTYRRADFPQVIRARVTILR
jgi:hypothetical protein